MYVPSSNPTPGKKYYESNQGATFASKVQDAYATAKTNVQNCNNTAQFNTIHSIDAEATTKLAALNAASTTKYNTEVSKAVAKAQIVANGFVAKVDYGGFGSEGFAYATAAKANWANVSGPDRENYNNNENYFIAEQMLHNLPGYEVPGTKVQPSAVAFNKKFGYTNHLYYQGDNAVLSATTIKSNLKSSLLVPAKTANAKTNQAWQTKQEDAAEVTHTANNTAAATNFKALDNVLVHLSDKLTVAQQNNIMDQLNALGSSPDKTAESIAEVTQIITSINNDAGYTGLF
jgi:hypothetical protein